MKEINKSHILLYQYLKQYIKNNEIITVTAVNSRLVVKQKVSFRSSKWSKTTWCLATNCSEEGFPSAQPSGRLFCSSSSDRGVFQFSNGMRISSRTGIVCAVAFPARSMKLMTCLALAAGRSEMWLFFLSPYLKIENSQFVWSRNMLVYIEIVLGLWNFRVFFWVGMKLMLVTLVFQLLSYSLIANHCKPWFVQDKSFVFSLEQSVWLL